MVGLGDQYRPLHAKYVAGSVPEAFSDRVLASTFDLSRGPRAVLAVMALVGLTLAAGEVGFAVLTTALLFALYLAYAHSPYWTLYYAETRPVIAMLSALGVWKLFSLRSRLRWTLPGPVTAPAALAAGLLVLLYIPFAVNGVGLWRRQRVSEQEFLRGFQQLIAAIPDPKAVVYVRYAPWHNVHTSVIANEPDLAQARVWLVYDRGSDNLRLHRAAPDRVTYLYDEEHAALLRYAGKVAAAR
jgi:hypothetical protein